MSETTKSLVGGVWPSNGAWWFCVYDYSRSIFNRQVAKSFGQRPTKRAAIDALWSTAKSIGVDHRIARVEVSDE